MIEDLPTSMIYSNVDPLDISRTQILKKNDQKGPKVLITCQCSDKFLGYDESVHEGCVIMMFMNRFIVNQKFITALTGDK